MALKPLKPSKQKRKDSKHQQQPALFQSPQKPQQERRNCRLYKLPPELVE